MSVRSESSGPYTVRFQAYEHAKFVAVLRGRFSLQIEGDTTPTHVRQSDGYVLMNGRPYRIFNADVPETDASALFSADRKLDGVVRWGDGAADTITVGSRVVFNPGVAAALRARLPSFIRVPGGTAEAELAGLFVPAHIAEPGERGQEPVHGGDGQFERARQIAGGPFGAKFGKCFQDGERPLDDLKRWPGADGILIVYQDFS